MITPMPNSNDSSTISIHAPSTALYRSRIEILRILSAVAHDQCLVSAEVGNGRLFVTRILLIDDCSDFIALEYGGAKTTNQMVFKQRSLEFDINHNGAHITFELTSPSETMVNGEPTIRFPLPLALVVSQRRKYARIPVSADISLRCVADDAGVMPFEVRIIDISLQGIGGMIYDRGIGLREGMILRGCRIMIPGGEAIVADLEVRNTATVTLRDGTLASRAGVRFLERPHGIEALIDMFVHDLDKDGA